jgi:hypothetical protein
MRSVGGKMLVIFLSRVLVGERRNHKPLLGCEFNYLRVGPQTLLGHNKKPKALPGL